MATYTTSDLSRKSGDIIADALRGPVTITQRKKTRLVMLSVEAFQHLRQYGDTRKAGTPETMPDEMLEAFERAVDAYEKAGEYP